MVNNTSTKFLCKFFALLIVIFLGFEFSNYTFSEGTSISDAEVAIVIQNYDELMINNAVDVTVITQPNVDDNATNRTMGNGMFAL